MGRPGGSGFGSCLGRFGQGNGGNPRYTHLSLVVARDAAGRAFS